MHNYFVTILQNASNNHCTVKKLANIDTIMGNFTPICQRYTDVMAHKYHLQHHLFYRTNGDAMVIVKLISMITNLQVLANSLQTIQVCIYIYM